jgi:hypothetical protein
MSNNTKNTPATTNKEYKRRREEAHTLPAFWDASSTVAASTFAARRLPELKSLYQHSVLSSKDSETVIANALPSITTNKTSSGGRKISSRHLRRRATSHVGRKRHRFPIGNETKVNNDSTNPNDTEIFPVSRPCRRKRRKPAQLEQEHGQCMNANESTCTTTTLIQSSSSPSTSCSTTSSSNTIAAVQWLPTHIWHAKRFRMQTLWNWSVPIMHSQRGANAALRLAQTNNKTLLQDATWCTQPLCIKVDCNEGVATTTANTCANLQAFLVALQRIVPDMTMQPATLMEQSMTVSNGLLYEPDQFPRGAVGPIRCIVSRNQPLLQFQENTRTAQNDTISRKSGYFLFYFWTHPSIRSTLFDLLSILTSSDSQETRFEGPYESCHFNECGMACLRLRGKSLATCVKASIQALAQKAINDDDDGIAKQDLDLDSAISRALQGGVARMPYSIMDEAKNSNLVFLPCGTHTNIAFVDSIASIDILCNASQTKELFLALIMQGGACPIGIVEEASLLMEVSSTPMLLFPRDYPDTEEGDTYWKGLADDWGYVRTHLDGGTGRIRPCGGPRLKEISWTDLVDSKDQGVVAMRGAFGEVLWDALQSAGNIPGTVMMQVHHSKKRRRTTRQQWELAWAPPLSIDAANKHTIFCNNLAQSLTLPAIIMCHLTILGKGTVKPGTEVRTAGKRNENLLLGFVTSASFSPKRGAFHALAICGAARWINAVSTASADDALLLKETVTGTRELQLGVLVGGKGKADPAFGSLSLVL